MSSIAGRFLNYLLTPLYTYQFVAGDYGMVTEMYAYVAFLVVLLTYGMETAYFRFVAGSADRKKAYASTLLPVAVSSAIFMTACIIFSPELAAAIEYPGQEELVTCFALIVGLDAISAIPMARLRNENRARRFALVNLSSIGLNIALNLFFIAYCKVEYDAGNANPLVKAIYFPEIGIGYIFIANLLSSILRTLLLLPQVTDIEPEIDKRLFMTMFKYAIPLLIAGIAGIVNENLDRLLLKYMLIGELGTAETMRQVGIYGACYKVSILVTLFVQAYRYAAEPFFFSRSSDRDARETYASLMKLFVIVCLFIFLAIMLNIDTVMLFVGEEYREGAVIVPILLMANIFLGIYYNLSVWYKLTDRTIAGAYIGLAGAAITIATNLILIPTLGYTGSAWATLLCYFTMASISYLAGMKYYPVPYPLLKISGYMMLALGLYAISDDLPGNEGSGILIKNAMLILAACFVYILERPKKIII